MQILGIVILKIGQILEIANLEIENCITEITIPFI